MIQSGIYKIKNLINGKIYIGSSKNLKKRWNTHKSLLENKKHNNHILQKAYNKYGIKNLKFEIVEIINEIEKLIEREQFYINKLNPQYNICKIAGNTLGFKFSVKSKLKMSILKKDKYNGKNNPMYGKKRPDLSLRNKSNIGKKLSKNTIIKIRTNRSDLKEVLKLSLDNKIIETYISIGDAARENNLKPCSIVNCCKGRRNSANGNVYRYKDII